MQVDKTKFERNSSRKKQEESSVVPRGGGGVLLLTLTFWRVNCGRGIHAEQHVKGIANLYFIQLKAIKSACEVTRGRHAK